MLQVKSERAAAARQRAELQAKVDRQHGQLSEARALQATTAAALSRVSIICYAVRRITAAR